MSIEATNTTSQSPVGQSNTVGQSNIVDQTNTISLQERELLVDLLERSRDRFLSCLSGMPADRWQSPSSDGGWTVHQCAEHLVLTEQAIRVLVRQTILASPSSPEQGRAVRGKDGIVIQAMRDRSQRRKTFDFLEPTGQWPEPSALVDRFQQERALTIEYVRVTADSLHDHVAPLEGLGDLDAYQWLLLLASHTDRHIAQIDAIGGQ
jgi:hypothetical protein